MTKQLIRVLSVLALMGFALLATVTTVSAQDDTPVTPDPQQNFGRGRRGGGMMGTGQGLMSEYMHEALAAELGITVEELAEHNTQGLTFWQIAEDSGYTQDEAVQMMGNARNAALEKMVVDGVITQEQADRMKQRQGGRSGSNSCVGSGFPRGGRSGR